ncbi:GNAT family N-acetyltransferase [Arcanobacterium phocae]|uniref:GNAT family N-acetyltransferase n=1 Tax=Arcanobacterium phocae TaxID=131112 RepID=UPI001C0EECBC|nr:GNAT family N-acetyltransferase [Arcanobacterium phocae]
MSALFLRPLGPDDEVQALEANAEFAGSGFDFLLKCDDETWSHYLARIADERAGVNLPQGRVPATFFGAFVEETLVGRVSIRHALNDYLLQYGGHIGYGVRPEYRRRGYATEILRQAVRYANSLGIDPVLVTCAQTNIGSRKTIESCGGVLGNAVSQSGIITRRYWIAG